MFRMTPAASREILASATRSEAEGLALRLAARIDEAGDVSFGMGFDEQRVDDLLTEFHGVKVLIGAPSQPLLRDAVLDFTEVEPGHHDFVLMAAETVEPGGCSSKPATNRGGCGNGGCGSCGQ